MRALEAHATLYTRAHLLHNSRVPALLGTRHILISWCSKFMSRTWVVLSQIAYRCFAPTASGNFFAQDTYFCRHTCSDCALISTRVVLAQIVLFALTRRDDGSLNTAALYFLRGNRKQTIKTVKAPFHHTGTTPMCRPQLARSTLAS